MTIGPRAPFLESDRGQATVETAMVLPVVLMALLLIVQVGVVVRDALALAQAAREGVRAGAVSADPDRALEAIHSAAGPLEAERIELELDPDPGEWSLGVPVTVRLAYRVRLSVPIVSRVVSLDLPLRSTATMRLERSAPAATPAPSPP